MKSDMKILYAAQDFISVIERPGVLEQVPTVPTGSAAQRDHESKSDRESHGDFALGRQGLYLCLAPRNAFLD
jgi:hypothetical protein